MWEQGVRTFIVLRSQRILDKACFDVCGGSVKRIPCQDAVTSRHSAPLVFPHSDCVQCRKDWSGARKILSDGHWRNLLDGSWLYAEIADGIKLLRGQALEQGIALLLKNGDCADAICDGRSLPTDE